VPADPTFSPGTALFVTVVVLVDVDESSVAAQPAMPSRKMGSNREIKPKIFIAFPS